jgi:two-component system cell cycle response regulator
MATITRRVVAPLERAPSRRKRGSTVAPPSTNPSWAAWLVAAMAGTVLLYAVDILFHPLPSAISELFQKFAASWVFFGAAVLCAMKGRASRDEATAWWLSALATALWGTASVYYALFLWDSQPVPVPSVADALWLAFYPPAYAALYKLLRQRSGSAGRGVWLDALVGGLGVGGAAAALAFQGVLEHHHRSAVAIATSLAYPIGDLGLLALVVATITVVGWKASGVSRWIAAAFGIFAVADGIYGIQVAAGTYSIGGVLDLGWPLAALLIGIAAWRPEAPVRPVPRTATTIALPTLFGLAALALLVLDHFVRLNPPALGLATASILVILARLYLTVRDNVGMLAQSRREAAADALTGLGNRRQLTADLAAHLGELDPDRPLMLTLFDLNGFKHYNDTFGHLAGDQLLERLGARLREVVGPRGAAYRFGGDEFCTLWNLPDGGQASITPIDVAAALVESGEAFSIDCSYGSALLPNDTIDPSEALQIADRHMYTHKSSRRTSAGQQSSDVLLRALTERDSELGVHLGGVADLACATAMQLDVPHQDMEATRQTALLHDVGKFAIPDQILNKTGSLDSAEWIFMKQHTLIGERIIAAAPALADVARFVRSTHERYDGTGYPDGLVGDATPLIARIVAVCDAYDAIITKRPYRESRDTSLAIDELRHCAGTQFDPDVVEALIAALNATADYGLSEILGFAQRPDLRGREAPPRVAEGQAR